MKGWLLAICAMVTSAAADESLLAPASQPMMGDLDAMIDRRVIRALVPPSRTQFWIDKGKQTGSQVDLLLQFEDELNKRHKVGKHVLIHVTFIPTPLDQLIPALLAGKGDLAAGILTVTEERQKQVDFADPFYRGVAEIVVTGPASPQLGSLEDLSGKVVFVHKSSSYWTHLEALSESFVKAGKAPILMKAAPEDLLDEDLLEMLNAGLVEIIVADRYVGNLWAKVFKQIHPRDDLRVHEGGEVAWMVRKDSPLLKAEISSFARKYGQGSAFGNSLVQKYTGSTRFVKSATSPGEQKKFQQMASIFQKYGSRYELDYLLMLAQGYQESRLNQSARSAVGAIGVMQVMPATGKDLATGDITKLEPNIHAGVKYIRFVRDRYFEPLPMTDLNKTLFSFAAYNAGPARVAQLRDLAQKKGLDPNIWLKNVEVVAAAKIGAETVTYVSNIYKYYIAYQLVTVQEDAQRKAQESVKKG